MSYWAPGLCFYGQTNKKLFSPGKRSRKTDLAGVWSFLMRGSGRPWGNGWSCVRGESVGYWENVLPSESGHTVEQATYPGNGHNLKAARAHRAFGQRFQAQDRIVGVSCADPGAGLGDPWGPSLTLSPSQRWHVPSPKPSPERGWAELAQPEVIHTFHFLSSGCGVAFWLYFSSVRRNFSSS